MKTLFITALLFVLGTNMSFSQSDITRKLQTGTWYVTGELGNGNLTMGSKKETGKDFELTFKNNGHVKYCANAKQAMASASVAGKIIEVGEFYCDDMYTYEVKNNVLNLNHGPANFYYVIKEKDGAYELTQTDYTKFK